MVQEMERDINHSQY